MPIRARLALFASLLLLLSTVFLTAAAFYVAREIINDQINLRLSVIANDRQKLLLAYVSQQHERVALVASRTRLRQLLADYQSGTSQQEAMLTGTRKILLDALDSTEGFLTVSITDPDGIIVTSTDTSMLDRDVSDTGAFQNGREEAYFSPPFFDGLQWRSTVSAPATASDQTHLGVAIVAIKIDRMVVYMSDYQGLGKTGEVLVGIPDAQGQFGYLFPPRHDSQLQQGRLANDVAMKKAIEGTRDFFTAKDYRGSETLVASAPLGYRDWGMIAKIDTREALAPITRLANWLVAMGGLTLLIGLVFAYVVARRVARPIRELTRSANLMATGEVSSDSRAFQFANDEVGDLAMAFATMRTQLAQQHDRLTQQAMMDRRQRESVEQLTTELKSSLESEQRSRQNVEQLLQGIRTAVDTLATATQNLKSVAATQVRTIQNQLVGVTETGSTVAEVTAAAQQTSQHASQVEQSSREAASIGQTGRGSIEQAKEAMHGVQSQFEETVTHVLSLAQRAQEIGSIIAVVNDIAEQTNVLALNAAVEASRAGEAGRGFAVVATEVKRLAQQSKESAQEIHRILTKTIHATQTSIESAERGHGAITVASDVIDDAAATIDRLAAIINDAATNASRILASTAQQASAMTQIQQAMGGVEQSSNDAMQASQDCDRAVLDLDRLGQELKQLMGATKPAPIGATADAGVPIGEKEKPGNQPSKSATD
ncbi:MAG: methyl-accepting chemotaxis protein [Pirellulaceae bacterium]|nr:methyl-accepting chemotaxis protein [Pirellulaceae bacterium]